MGSMAGNGTCRVTLADLRLAHRHRAATTKPSMAALDHSARVTSRVLEDLGFPLPGRRSGRSANPGLRIARTRRLKLQRHDEPLVTAHAGDQLS